MVEGEPPFLAGTALATATAVVHGAPAGPRAPGPAGARSSPGCSPRTRPADPSAGAVRATLTRVGQAPPSSTTSTPVSPMVAAPVAASPPTPAPAAANASPASTAVHRPAPPRTKPTPRSAARAVAVVAALAVVVGLIALRGGDGGGGGEAASPPTRRRRPRRPPQRRRRRPCPRARLPQGGRRTRTRPAPTRSATRRVGGAAGRRQPHRLPRSGHGHVRAGRVDATRRGPTRPAPGARPSRASGPATPTTSRLASPRSAYRDYPAAMWEFRHGSGETLHTGNLGFIAAGRGYALDAADPRERVVGRAADLRAVQAGVPADLTRSGPRPPIRCGAPSGRRTPRR